MTSYPRSAYHFKVEWGGTRLGVAEITGLDIELAVIEHREGSDPEQVARKIPGARKFSNIVLKRGIVAGDNDFFAWINTAQGTSVERRDLVITLLNETHNPVVAWKVRSAFPCKYSGPQLRANANEVAFESLELAHEGLVVEVA